jgi:hypothetical protein
LYIWGNTRASAMAQAVSRQPLTAKTRVRTQINPSGICGGQSGTGTCFFSELFCLPLAILFHGGSLGGWTIGLFVAAVQRHGLALAAWTTTTTWSNTHVTTRHLAELCNVGVTTFDVYQYSSSILSLKMSLISFYAYVTTNSWQYLIISNNNQLNTCGSHDIKNINLHMYINTCCLKV